MNVWKHLKGLNPAALWALALLCIRYPWWVLPTVKATRECIAECNLQYGKEHHRNTAANAFRHALWNYYIAQACNSRSTQMEKVLQWTKKFTDWHEDFSKNPPLARIMDLHNNGVGRILFEQKPHLQNEDLIAILKSKAGVSKKVTTIEEIASIGNDCFVHIKD